jgi:DNA adenine methylase
VFIECLPYAEIIKRYDSPETVFYIDPPYWGIENYYGSGLFSQADFFALAQQLAGIKGRFILSLNDKPEVREIFSRFEIDTVQTRYTCNAAKNTSELLICN